jgi:hypothetical protein
MIRKMKRLQKTNKISQLKQEKVLNELSTPIALRSMEVVSLPQPMAEVGNSCFVCRFREQPRLMKLPLIHPLQVHSQAPLSL